MPERHITRIIDWNNVPWDEVDFENFDRECLLQASLMQVNGFNRERRAYEEQEVLRERDVKAEAFLREVLINGEDPYEVLPGIGAGGEFLPEDFLFEYITLRNQLLPLTGPQLEEFKLKRERERAAFSSPAPTPLRPKQPEAEVAPPVPTLSHLSQQAMITLPEE